MKEMTLCTLILKNKKRSFKMSDKYRFDDAYSDVYILKNNTYMFECTYTQAGIRSQMDEQRKINKMEAREILNEQMEFQNEQNYI